MKTRYSYNISYFYVESILFSDETSSSMFEEHIKPREIYKGVSVVDNISGDETAHIIPIYPEDYSVNQCFIFSLPDPIGAIEYKIKKVDIEKLPVDIVLESNSFLKAAKWLEERGELNELKFISTLFKNEYLPKVASFFNIVVEQAKRIKEQEEREGEGEDFGTDFESGRIINTEDIITMLDALYDSKPMVFSSIVNLIANVSEDL